MEDFLDLLTWLGRAFFWFFAPPFFLSWRAFLLVSGIVLGVLLWLWGAYPFLPSPLPAWQH